MKVKFYLAMVVAAFLMSNCSQDEPLTQTKNSTNTLTAFIENASRSTVSDGGAFSWNDGDAIAVGNADGDYTEFVYGDETFTAQTAIVPTGYAIYPNNEDYTSLPEGTALPTITLPNEYAYGSTNAPMLATITEDATSLTFSHLAGLMRFRVKNIPSTAAEFSLTAEGKDITGSFTPTTDSQGTYIQAGTTGTDNEVKITFTAENREDVMDFYVPMPVGEYTSLKVKIGEKELSSNQGVTNTIARGKLLLMPTMVFENGDLKLEGGNDNNVNVSLNENEEVSLDVSNGEKVVVEMIQGTTATLILTAPDNSSEGLTISDGSEEGTASSQTSNGILNVSATNASTLNINTPTLTVKLTSGEYDKVEALTAQQTLIIGNGVKIGELVLNGGNVKLEGDLVLNKQLVIKEGITTTIDLNGYTMSHEIECTESYQMINNKGNLTITGKGKISFKDTSDGDPTFGWGSYTIRNEGTLVVEDAIIEHLGEQNQGSVKHMYCAIFQYSGSTTINDGTISTPTYRSVRLWKGEMTINGGNFEGQVWVQSVDDSAILNITDGTFAPRGVDGSSVFIGNKTESNVVHNVNFNVKGGTFTTKVGFNDQSTITGGISGGTFSEFSFLKLLADIANVNVKLNSTIAINATLTIPAKNTVNLDLNGYNLNYTVDNEKASAIFDNRGTLIISNTGSNKNAEISFTASNPDTQEIPTYATNTITNEGTLIINENVTVTNDSDGGASYAVDDKGVFTLNGGTLIGNRCALRIAKFNQDDVKFTMNSGLVKASTPAWIHLPGSDGNVAPKITVEIKNGEMVSTKESDADNNVMYTYSYGNSYKNTKITISDGKFLGGTVSIGSGYYNDVPTCIIEGGTFDYDVLKWTSESESEVIYSATNAN